MPYIQGILILDIWGENHSQVRAEDSSLCTVSCPLIYMVCVYMYIYIYCIYILHIYCIFCHTKHTMALCLFL